MKWFYRQPSGAWRQLVINVPTLEHLSLSRGGLPSSVSFGALISQLPRLRNVSCDKFVIRGYNFLHMPRCRRIDVTRGGVEHLDILYAPKLRAIDLQMSDGLHTLELRDWANVTAEQAVELNTQARKAGAEACNGMLAALQAAEAGAGAHVRVVGTRSGCCVLRMHVP